MVKKYKIFEEMEKSTLDSDTEVFNFFFENRDEFVVDFDPKKIEVISDKKNGTVRFKISKNKVVR